MNDTKRPIIVGQPTSIRIGAILLAIGVDLFLVILAANMIKSANPAGSARTVAISVLAVLLIAGAS